MDISRYSAYRTKRKSFSELESMIAGKPVPLPAGDYLNLDKMLNDANSDILSDGQTFYTIGKVGDSFQMWKLDMGQIN